jgi:hypothetical protein
MPGIPVLYLGPLILTQPRVEAAALLSGILTFAIHLINWSQQAKGDGAEQ